jgi:hypothetical protein
MKNQIIPAIAIVIAGLAFLLSCGQPAQQPPSAPAPVTHPPSLCVLCVDDKRVDILDLEQRGKLIKSIPLPSSPGLMRVSPLAANLAITDGTGIIRILTRDFEQPQQFTLDFAPADIGFATHKIWLLSDPVRNQVVAFSIVDNKILKTIATPAGPANYVTKVANEGTLVYLACIKARQLVEIDMRSREIKRSLNLPGTPGEMLLDEINKNYIYMTLPDEGKLIRINLLSLTVDATLDLVAGVRYLTADSTFSRLYISLPPASKGASGSVAVVKLPELGRVLPDPISDTKLTDPGHLVVFDAILNSPAIYVCNPSSNNVALVDINSYKVVEMIPTGKKPLWLGYIPGQEKK